nr:MAG TPA: hypothetical protein [Caudoviricetes sp.]
MQQQPILANRHKNSTCRKKSPCASIFVRSNMKLVALGTFTHENRC